MTGFDRRRMLCSLACAVVFAPALRANTSGPLILPSGPMVLRRVLERELAGGAKLTVTREWECRFVANGSGIRVEGSPKGVTVEAPPKLAGLAEIERTRAVAGPFPALLDAHGIIVSASADDSQQQVDEASKLALARLGEGGAHEEVQAFLSNVGNSEPASADAIPADLFFPSTRPVHEERALPLPGGENGRLVIETTAEADPDTGLLKHREKRILTRIGTSERMAREIWELAPA